MLSARVTRLAGVLAALSVFVSPRLARAVGQGTDTSDYRNVVFISTQVLDGRASACTATLVTPTWLLTANHCITGDYMYGWPTPANSPDYQDPSLVNVSVFFRDAVVNASPGKPDFTHTAAISGPAVVRMLHVVDSTTDEDSARDLALVRPSPKRPRSACEVPCRGAACGVVAGRWSAKSTRVDGFREPDGLTGSRAASGGQSAATRRP